MSIEQSDVIDLIGVENDTGKVVLTISDHLDWDSPNSHLRLLQDKINRYVDFVDSGEIEDSYPNSKDRIVLISV
jgi:hypothetical protein